MLLGSRLSEKISKLNLNYSLHVYFMYIDDFGEKKMKSAITGGWDGRGG